MTSGNPVLDKNLECIEKYNPALKEKLLSLPYLTNDIRLIETCSKEPNLTYNSLPLHSQIGAENEAKAIFDKTEDDTSFIHFILGIGLGHLFNVFCENAKGRVILYESNIEILRVTLELVDLSKELSQTNVRIASDFEELRQMFCEIYRYNTKINFAILDSYRNIYGESAQKILDYISFINKDLIVNFRYLKKSGFEHISMLLDNLVYTLNDIPLYEIKDLYKGKTALIVSAGPTLDLNIETIKKNQDKFVIFSVGTAFKALVQNGIKPDFLNVIEILDCIGQVKGLDVSDVKLILTPTTNNSFHKLKTKQKFIYPPNTGLWGQYWGELTDIDVSPYFGSGTVSYNTLYSAKILGFEKIILVGSDFAYVNNSCYSKNSSYSELVFETNPETGKPEYKISNYDSYIKSIVPEGTDITEPWCRELADKNLKTLNSTLQFVKGISGEMLPTKIAYAMYLESFKDFAAKNKHLELINTSMLGAQVDGFENIPLEKIVEDLAPIDKLEISSPFKFNKKQIFGKLKAEEKMLREILVQFKQARMHLSNYEKELKSNGDDTEIALISFRELLLIYKSLYLNYFSKSKLYKMISLDENFEIEYIVKINRNKEAWFKALKEYYENVEEKLLTTVNKINGIVKNKKQQAANSYLSSWVSFASA